jgi:MFS transporter, SHS family, lactate transporter
MAFLAPLRSLSSPQRHAFAACFLGWSLDAFDYFILVFCISAIAADFHTATKAVAEALFLTLAFRPVGAALFGFLADRFGRRPTLIVNILCYSALELGCAFVPSLNALLVLRALFGIAMGGEWGVGAALAFETLPKEGRGFFSGLLQEGYAVGYLAASALFAVLFPIIGWRGMFMVGASPALVAGYIGLKVEESPTWKTMRHTKRQIKRPSKRQGNVGGDAILEHPSLWQGIRGHVVVFLFLIVLMAGFNAFSHGTQDLYPTFLQKDHGFDAHITGTLGIVLNIGALTGGIVFGTLSEHWGRKRAIIVAALLAIPVIPLYARSHSIAALAAGGFLMQFMVQGAWGVVPAYLSELSPSAVRATFPGLAYQLGNLLASRISVIQASIADRTGSYGRVLAMTALIVGLFLAIVTAFGRESRGTDLAGTDLAGTDLAKDR